MIKLRNSVNYQSFYNQRILPISPLLNLPLLLLLNQHHKLEYLNVYHILHGSYWWFCSRCIPQWTNIFSRIFHSCHHPNIFRQWVHLQGPHLKQIFIEIVYRSVVNHDDRDHKNIDFLLTLFFTSNTFGNGLFCGVLYPTHFGIGITYRCHWVYITSLV